jgi:hypothetical protein
MSARFSLLPQESQNGWPGLASITSKHTPSNFRGRQGQRNHGGSEDEGDYIDNCLNQFIDF